jgi:hypothetical protein
MQQLIAEMDAAVLFAELDAAVGSRMDAAVTVLADWMQHLVAEMDSAVSSRTLSAVSSIGAVCSRTGCRNCNRTGNSS